MNDNYIMSKLQNTIVSTFGDLKWRKKALRNECSDRRDQLEFHNSQKFIKEFFRPNNPQKGILAYHTVGSGKTATAVYAASGFEQDYQIIWVTHHKLRNAMWKNIFGAMSAHPAIRNFQGQLPRTEAGKKRTFGRLTNKNWVQPMTYKQFSNALQIKNKEGVKLEKRNQRDLLYKTLVIVDEAHNLYNEGLSTAQKPDLDVITKAIHKSYKKSGNNSVKVLLLSATPITNDIVGFAKMMNLLIPQKTKRLPTRIDIIFKSYLNNDFTQLNSVGKSYFKKLGKYVSYLNVSKDKNIFAQPSFITNNISLTGSGISKESIQKELDDLKLEKIRIKEECTITHLNNNLKEFIKLNIPTDIKVAIIKTNFPDFAPKDIKLLLDEKDMKESCNGMNKQAKKTCLNNIKERVKIAKTNNREISKLCKKNRTTEFKQKQKVIKDKKKEFTLSQKSSIQRCEKIIARNEEGKKRKVLCVEKSTLWPGSYPAKYRFDNLLNFPNNTHLLRADIPKKSPKLHQLLQNIELYDRMDMDNHGTQYKHIIFVKNGGYYGTSLVLSALLANNFNLQIQPQVYRSRPTRRNPNGRNKIRLVIPNTIIRDPYNVLALASSMMYTATMTKALQKQVVETFNNRNNNTYGGKVRFIVIDKNYLEGIDLFDVKYLHVIDTALFDTEVIQLIGRGTRTCGQAGLTFRNGWELKVIQYNTMLEGENFDEKIKDKRLEFMNLTQEVVQSRKILEKALKDFAIDKKLTEKL